MRFVALLLLLFLKSRAQREGALRLVGGRGPWEGNVEIFHVGRWGSVCDDEWDLREAHIVCKNLGFRRAVRATYDSEFGRGQNLIWMDSVYCTGDERALQECRFDGWGIHDCSIAEAAGVVCDNPNARREPAISHDSNESPSSRTHLRLITEKDIVVRLVGGRNQVEGRVEVRIGNRGWGLVCGDGWGIMEASVICRQMGYGFAKRALQSSFFGGEAERIVLSGIKCAGYEKNLADCGHEKFGNVFCPGREQNIAGVVCAAELPDLELDWKSLEQTSFLEDRQLHELECAMEENCVARPAYFQIQRPGGRFTRRRLLRFTARTANIGNIDFRPFIPKHLWKWHACHKHFHSMEVFAHFDIMDLRGRKVAEGHKASFCLEDNECKPGFNKKYVCANYGDQGVSVGCYDVYKYDIDCQWVDITELPVGNYYFKVSVNPEYKVPELTFNNNAATCSLHYNGLRVHVHNCTLGRP